MRAVNLLPDPRTDKRHADRPSRLQSTKAIAAAAGAVLVLVAAVSGVAFTKARSDVSDRQSTLNGLQAELAGVQAKAAVSATAADQTQAHLAAVSTAASGRIAWDGLLDQLSRVMPRGAWLESLQGTNAAPAVAAPTSTSTPSTPAAGAAPTGFVVTGYARSQATVARALDRLVLMPALSDVSLQTSERTRRRNEEGIQVHDRRQRALRRRDPLMKDKLSPKVVLTLTAVAVAAALLIGWFGLVSPQRSQASSLDQTIQETQTQLVVAKANARPAGRAKMGASQRSLRRAMPQRVAMPAMLRQLLRISKRTGVRLDKVTPQPATTLQGYEVVPMDVVVAGRYLPVQRFLHRLRVQARVAGDGVHASGRLFSVDTLNLAADEQLPRLTATIRVNGFVYDNQAPAPAPAATDASNSVSAAGGMSK